MNSQRKKTLVRVAIVLPERVWAGSVLLTKELLMIAGTLFSRTEDLTHSAIFDVILVSISRKPICSLSGTTITPDTTLSEIGDCDVVIIPAQFAPRGEIDANELSYISWISSQHTKGALIISINGAVMLAKCGLLDNKQATGVRSEAPIFKRFFPLVRFMPSRHIVVNDQMICAGGINPTAEICAHLIERFFGQSAARKFKHHTTTHALLGNEQLAVWSAQFKQHADQQILALQTLIENNLNQPPSSAILASSVHMSERTMTRRFTSAVGKTIRRYAADCRMEMAVQMLRTSEAPLQVIANECGFSSTSALIHSFTLEFGISPVRYRRNFLGQ